MAPLAGAGEFPSAMAVERASVQSPGPIVLFRLVGALGSTWTWPLTVLIPASQEPLTKARVVLEAIDYKEVGWCSHTRAQIKLLGSFTCD